MPKGFTLRLAEAMAERERHNWAWCEECGYPYRGEDLVPLGSVYVCRWHWARYLDGLEAVSA